MTTHLFAFFVFLGFAMAFSIGAMRAAHYFYAKIVTCHPAKYHLSEEDYSRDLIPGEDYEKLASKLLYLYIYNMAIAVTTLLVLLIYQTGPFGSWVHVSIENMITIIGGVLVLNFSLRVTSLVDVNSKTKYFESIIERSLSFGYSFLLTLYFLSMIGIGNLALETGFGFSAEFSLGSSNITGGAFFLLVLLGPLVSAIISEAALHPKIFGVKEDGFDDL